MQNNSGVFDDTFACQIFHKDMKHEVAAALQPLSNRAKKCQSAVAFYFFYAVKYEIFLQFSFHFVFSQIV